MKNTGIAIFMTGLGLVYQQAKIYGVDENV